MSYVPISPFPLSSVMPIPELHALASVWSERKAKLEGDQAYKEFVKRLQREWAIETGIVERLYTWDRGVTEVLIEQGIESSVISHHGGVSQREAEHIQAIISDQLDIIEGLFGFIRGEEPLTEHFIRELQARFTANQSHVDALTETGQRVQVVLKRGEYKTLPNNPRRPDGTIHPYCPPELTKDEMERLIQWYRGAESTYPVEIKAAWLHHRFTQIHPFQDGNGRVARALASLVFLREGLFPVVIREADRKEYIEALETADREDLSPLVQLFARRQRDAILKALGIEQQVQQGKYADQILRSALDLLRARFSQEHQRIGVVFDYADRLFLVAEERFRDLAQTIDGQIRPLTPPQQGQYHARKNSAQNSSTNRHYFHQQIVDIAKQFNYFANFERYRSWVRLTLSTSLDFDFVISFHGYGPGDTGILAASAFTYVKAAREDGGTEPVDLHPASTDLFQFNYIEPYDSSKSRFEEWLESAIAIALSEWKRSL